MHNVNLEDVFKASGVPTYTFVQPKEYTRLKVAIRTKGRGLILEGPSGIGKTTSIIKVLSENNISQFKLLSSRKPSDIEIIKTIPMYVLKGHIIVDDFHILDLAIKQQLSDFLKVLADTEDEQVKLILVGINKAGDSLVRLSNDLNNRIETIKFEANSEEKIKEMITLGEKALNVEINIKDQISSNSNGSFHIAQLLCYQTCIYCDLSERSEEAKITTASYEVIKSTVLADLKRVFFEKAKLFASGSRIRREGRAPYLSLLKWLSESKDWALTIDHILNQHPKMKNSVNQIVDKGYLEKLIKDNDELSSVLHYDANSKTISIEDPKFFYYIKNLAWGEFSTQIGYIDKKFDKLYDIALSFAGENRDLAEKIFDQLSEREISVFYDKNEQHRILAEEVEEYLAPIYSSEANYVVTLLSNKYPEKIWTKFESDNFKKRFGENAIIPIWYTNTSPGFFDTSRNYGGISFDPNGNLDIQATEIVETIAKKLASS